jgi:succinyl-CoA synthetase beta subunit
VPRLTVEVSIVPKLPEYEGKKLLRNCGITVPDGAVASTVEEARKIAENLGKAVVIKSQVEITERLKAGGIRFAKNADEAEKFARELLGSQIKGVKVERLLVEERLPVKEECYASVVVNDSWKVKGPILMFSTRGGTGIEEIATRFPEEVASMEVDVIDGLSLDSTRDLVARLVVQPQMLEPLAQVAYRLYEAFRQYDARSVEVNPIVVTEQGEVYAADCHIVLDEASVFKHPELRISYPRDIGRAPTELERLAWKVEEKDFRGVGYFVQMTQGFKPGDGVVGFHGIGGGGAMLGADALIRHGLKLANYADTSGNPTASKVYRIVKLIFSQPNIDGYVLMGACIANQEQWHHAHALVRALREELPNRPGFPVIILIAGNKEAESLEILREGLKGLPAKIELYGRDYVYNVDYVAERMKKLTEEYRRI